VWDQANIQEGLALVEKAFNMRHIGPYQIQAAISALHTQAASSESTDWEQIAGLYEQLRHFQDTPIIRLNQAVAVSMFAGLEQGLQLVQGLADDLIGFAPFHLACADMLQRMGKADEAHQAYERALELTHNQVEKEFILEQIRGSRLDPGE
jgi:RNA polymerase sigma-70 factor, ECF subfamily